MRAGDLAIINCNITPETDARLEIFPIFHTADARVTLYSNIQYFSDDLPSY